MVYEWNLSEKTNDFIDALEEALTKPNEANADNKTKEVNTMTYYTGMQVIIYDEDDNIITVLTSAKDVNAFINGYYGNIIGMDHFEIVY